MLVPFIERTQQTRVDVNQVANPDVVSTELVNLKTSDQTVKVLNDRAVGRSADWITRTGASALEPLWRE
jgi:hypothetical protein